MQWNLWSRCKSISERPCRSNLHRHLRDIILHDVRLLLLGLESRPLLRPLCLLNIRGRLVIPLRLSVLWRRSSIVARRHRMAVLRNHRTVQCPRLHPFRKRRAHTRQVQTHLAHPINRGPRRHARGSSKILMRSKWLRRSRSQRIGRS